MKKLTIISMFLLIVLASNIAFAETGIVNTPAVRIREKASTNSKVITKAYEDDEVEILGEEEDWYQVKFDGKTGYASKSLIKKKGNTSAKNETPANNTANTNNNTTTNNSVAPSTPAEENKTEVPAETGEPNTIKEDTAGRVMPNFASNETVLLTKGTKVEVVRKLNNWCQITLNGSSSWILTNKVNLPEELTKPSKPAENKPAENTTTEENTSVNTQTNTNVAEGASASNTVDNGTIENTTTGNSTTTENTASNPPAENTAPENTTASSNQTTRSDKGRINVETANIRSKASTSSKRIDTLDIGDEVTILGEEGEWYKIKAKGIESGYVSKSLVTVLNVSSRSDVRDEEVPQANDEQSSGEKVAEYAKQYLGTDYVLGGKTPETGFDCSGFTRYVYKNFGYSLGTVAADQNDVGTEIERDDLQIGDLILFYNEEKTKIGHTGVYIGNDEFVHAANPDRGVVTDNLKTNSYYSERFVTARRIVE